MKARLLRKKQSSDTWIHILTEATVQGRRTIVSQTARVLERFNARSGRYSSRHELIEDLMPWSDPVMCYPIVHPGFPDECSTDWKNGCVGLMYAQVPQQMQPFIQQIGKFALVVAATINFAGLDSHTTPLQLDQHIEICPAFSDSRPRVR
jgi:hypothetical protein